MGVAVFLFHEVDIVGGDDFDVVFLRQLEDDLVDLLLAFVHLGVAAGLVGLVALHLEVIVVAKEVLEPLYRGLGAFDVAVHDLLRHLASEASGAAYQALVVFLEEAVIDTRIIIKTFCDCY